MSKLSIYEDSGAPHRSGDYTTIVLLHGYTWHSGGCVSVLHAKQTTHRRYRYLLETGPSGEDI